MTQLYLSYDAVSKYNTRTQELALMVLNFIITRISIFFGFEYYLGHTLSSCSGINSVYTDTRNIGLNSIAKPTRCTISQIYLFWNNTLYVSDGLSVHRQESKTVQTASGIRHTGSVAAC
jgi:hypothetical protein